VRAGSARNRLSERLDAMGVQHVMATKLTHPIRREIVIDDESYTVVISPDGLRMSRKRFRSGRHVSWEAMWHLGAPENTERVHDEPVPGEVPTV
jgi:hypothetical protein